MSSYLLDTPIFLWSISMPEKLSAQVRTLIIDGRNTVYLSAASVWEISIKRKLGKLKAPDDIDKIADLKDFRKLPINILHAELAGALPEYHRDPFDRMLIAQATMHDLHLITCDACFKNYEIKVVMNQ